MLKNVVFSFSILCLLLNDACNKTSEKVNPPALEPIGNVSLYTFSSDDQYFLSKANTFALSPETSIKEALVKLGRHLTKTYFMKSGNESEGDIEFEVIEINNLKVEPKPLRVAVINMIDRDGYALKEYFQGSTGGQTTFAMVGATFIQPHLDPPLLDGLVILYNGEMLPELDHINLSGILTPRLVKYSAKRAINNTRMETADRDGGRIKISELN